MKIKKKEMFWFFIKKLILSIIRNFLTPRVSILDSEFSEQKQKLKILF